MMPSCEIAAMLIGVYVLAGLSPVPGGRWRPMLLSLPVAAAAVWPIGFAWPGGAVAVIAFAASMAGYHFQDAAKKATWWLLAQAGVLASLAGLATVAWSTEAIAPPEIIAGVALIAGAIITVEWGGEWVGRAIQPFAEALSEPLPHEANDGIIQNRGLPGGFADGGRMIGRLERLLVFLFVIVGAPTAIGVLVAAKSILRFGEIKDSDSRKAAEYIIIGTLMSFGFALVASYLTRFAIITFAAGSSHEGLLRGFLG
jgi:hypothetical protein